jgi:cytochrome c-type biogenesis protein
MQHINILTSFLAGVFVFLAPCTLPLVPGFAAFISHGEKERTVKTSILFCIGFLATFLVFGVLAGLLGQFLSPIKPILQIVGGLFVVFLGFYMLGLLKLSIFHGQILGESFRAVFRGRFSPFLFGVSIALGWSPCVGPVLAGIFFYATFSYSVFQALWLFLFFSLGFILPFLFISYLVSKGKSAHLGSSKAFSVLAGILLVFVGILLLSDRFNLLAVWAYKILHFLNYETINKFL